MSQSDHGFTYKFEPPAHQDPPGHTLLLLHGTGGNENDLLGIGEMIAPGAAKLSPRGKVLENGMPRFFRRLAEGVFDVDDLKNRTHEMADFIKTALQVHEVTDTQLIAVGFSNGANMAGSLLLMYPELLAGAVLYRPMVPFVPEVLPDLSGKRLLVVPGRQDPLIPVNHSEEWIDLLLESGADVSVAWQPGGHGLTTNDISVARDWLQGSKR